MSSFKLSGGSNKAYDPPLEPAGQSHARCRRNDNIMTNSSSANWQSIIELVSELKRCDEYGITTASVAMAYVCIDALANLSRPINKPKVTRSDFIE